MNFPRQKLNALDLPWPTDWTSIFGRDRPIILEIGFGRGTFVRHLARTLPEYNVVGIEISNRCMTHAEAMIAHDGLLNARVVHSMAETALHHVFTAASLSQVHINFPDPWFRTRHSHRRLMQRDTLNVIVNRLLPEGLFYLATDIREYAEMSHDLLAETPGLENLLHTPWANALPERIVTKYESKARREGRDCYYFAYRRNHQPPPPVAMIQELPMPHLVFQSPLTLDDVEARFEEKHIQPIDGTYIHFLRVWSSDRHLLFETHIKEPTIDQRLALTLSARDDGRLTLQLSTLGHPRPTEGVHLAVNLLGDWLLALHPDAQVVVRKLQEDA
ncbi:MAG: tRNA (guanosine(46)-N7)-methyltransferase TrmB [Anaerolineae bacterium]|nr:tRNA (guanosine(46)-N7)-methyltransferase TrmB [Anaerolineae bacterium]